MGFWTALPECHADMSYTFPTYLPFTMTVGVKRSCILPGVIRTLHNCKCCCLQVTSKNESVAQPVLYDSHDSPRALRGVSLRRLGVFLPELTEQTQDDTRLQERSSLHGQRLWQTGRKSHVHSRKREHSSWVYARQVGRNFISETTVM
jgi:hypothetical protein